jgi:L-iditol 2-dehydrogenase
MWLVEPNHIEEREIPIFDVGPDEVLIKVAYCGICPWDLRAYLGKKQVPLPRLLGHELSGWVEKTGENVTDLKAGQRVVGDFIVKCGYCDNCREGRGNKCFNPTFAPGGYVEYAKCPRRNIHVLRSEKTSMKAAAFTEPLATVCRGQSLLELKPGDFELVVGAGPIGQMHAQVARLYGARVIVADLLQERLDKALELGADYVVNSLKVDLVESVKEITRGKGANAAVVAVQSSPLVVETANAMADGGRLNIFAGIYPVDPLMLDPNIIHYKELKILGSADSTGEEFHQALGFIEDGRVKTEPLISHLLPLEKLQEGLDIVARNGGMKVMIRVGGDD